MTRWLVGRIFDRRHRYLRDRFGSDRGQAGAALGLLIGMEGPGVDDLVEFLTPFAGPGPMSAGRNEPCPCGSGRKHKVCCAVRGGWPLRDRMPWLMRKLMAFYASPAARDTVLDVARSTGMAEEGAADSYRDTAALNLALFEGGVIADLCDLRGSLLPADELELLRDWSRVRAGLYELVEEADADGTCTLLDLFDGERTTFADGSLAARLEVGDAVLAWLVTDEAGTAPFHSVVPVPDRARDSLLDLLDDDLSATVLARWLRDLHAPPRLATTAGDAWLDIRQVYAVGDVDAARRVLAEHLEEDEDDGVLRAFEERRGTRWLKGSVEVVDGQLRVATTSAPRAAWFAELIARVVPEVELIDEQRLPAADLVGTPKDDEEEADDDGPAGGLIDLDALAPEARQGIEEQLEAMMASYEDAWVDEPVPALGGATPREAADDPTRRETLLRLLDDVERTRASWTGPGRRGMDPDRLRRLLGLA
ncbi:MAG: SEC-C domain-containing protein [Nitriliruptor sp.]|uniref:SEC-C domain-containing protein n=1 Tax=Nitriliruptor sp. TaxID=2448056 RepID=UPI00349FFB21